LEAAVGAKCAAGVTSVGQRAATLATAGYRSVNQRPCGLAGFDFRPSPLGGSLKPVKRMGGLR
jgi:hypothetical protein